MTSHDGKATRAVETRLCQQCRALVEHTSFSVRYNASTSGPNAVLKTFRWVCSRCGEEKEESREVMIPSSRARLITRLLKMRDDYGIHSMRISAENGKLIVQMAFGDPKDQSA